MLAHTKARFQAGLFWRAKIRHGLRALRAFWTEQKGAARIGQRPIAAAGAVRIEPTGLIARAPITILAK